MIAALTVALLLQIAANLANDGFDHARGADAPGRLGPLRVTQQGLLSFRQVMTRYSGGYDASDGSRKLSRIP